MTGDTANYVAMARSRLDHACHRLNELMHACSRYLASTPFIVERELFVNHDAIPCVRFRYRVTALPPVVLGLLAGEVVHQLRATLDNLAWALGQVYPSPNKKAKNEKLAFPVAESEEKYQKLLDNSAYLGIRDFPNEAQSVLLDAQSFRRSLHGPDLWVLHQLWNADKHKVPSVFIAHSGGVSQDMDLRAPAFIGTGEIADGVVFVEGALPPQGIAPDAAPRLTAVVLGVNDPVLPYAKYAFEPLLYGHIQLVNGVIDRLTPLLHPATRHPHE